ncbi:MAG: YIP1 family protein [Ignavibacteriae bacterium]|nr:YIP1 family protein [Ignavibacteria bacterium]MBI3365341.1 YIP1 family protein [Ignavibacteriota bacterium]
MEQEISPVSAATATTSSFMTRAANVFASPSELYNEVAATPAQTSSWLIPYILSAMIGAVFVLGMYSNPELRSQMAEPGRQAIQEQVASGTMTQEQADRAAQFMDSPLFLFTGMGGGVVMASVAAFGIPLLLWLIVQLMLKTPTTYKKMLEVYGISTMIAVLGTIATILLINAMNSMRALPAPSLIIMNSYDYHNLGHRFLGSLNIFTAWQMIVLGIGVAKISSRTTGVGIGTTMGVWVLWLVIATLAGCGVR